MFGLAPRGSGRWEEEISGLYAGLHVVGEMKRTDRERDWPFATALGVKMLKTGDLRGWLHLFDAEILLAMKPEFDISEDLISRRPLLRLVRDSDRRLRGALHCERLFWQELDRIRLAIYRQALKPYATAVRTAGILDEENLQVVHERRTEIAEETLAQNPLREYGFDEIEKRAKEGLKELLGSDIYFEWLPKVRNHFPELNA